MSELLKVSLSKKVVLKYELAANLPAIEADAAQLPQVVMNLIINASEAIGENRGVIGFATGVMECDSDYRQKTLFPGEEIAGGVYVYFEVSDTGCGINEETKAKIFDPFFTTKFTGRGLGLATVLGIARAHKGAIELYSEPDKGTTIKVLFPAIQQSAEKLQRPGAGVGTGQSFWWTTRSPSWMSAARCSGMWDSKSGRQRMVVKPWRSSASTRAILSVSCWT